GTDYRPASPLDARRHGIAHIHQELSLCAHVSVAENILMGMEPSRWGWVNHDALHRRTAEILKRFHHPEIVPEKRVSELSLAACPVVEIYRTQAQEANDLAKSELNNIPQHRKIDRVI